MTFPFNSDNFAHNQELTYCPEDFELTRFDRTLSFVVYASLCYYNLENIYEKTVMFSCHSC